MLSTIGNSIKKGLAATLFLAMIVCSAIIAPDAHNAYLRHEVGRNVVQVIVTERGGGGTGFAVKGKSGKQYVMTNKHVCEASEDGKTVWLRKDDEGRGLRRKILYIDKIHDLCIVQGRKDLSALDIGSIPEKGDLIYVIGHPGLRQLTVAKGEYIGYEIIQLPDFQVLSREKCEGTVYELPPILQLYTGLEFVCMFDYRSYSITAPVYGGNSGSPVVNKYGNLIGVLFAGNPDQEHNNYVVPLSHVQRVLARF